MRKKHEITFGQWLACVSVCQNKIWRNDCWLTPDNLGENLQWWKDGFESGASPEDAVLFKLESILEDED